MNKSYKKKLKKNYQKKLSKKTYGGEGGWENEEPYKTEFPEQRNFLQMIAKEPHVNKIRNNMRKCLRLLIRIVVKLCKIKGYDQNEVLKIFFSHENDPNDKSFTGSMGLIPIPGVDLRKQLEEVIYTANCRELCYILIKNFTYGGSVGEFSGCSILWEIYNECNNNKWNEFINDINPKGIQNTINILEDTTGYNFKDIYNIYIERQSKNKYPAWCNLAIPVWFKGNRITLTAPETGERPTWQDEYTFPFDLTPVVSFKMEKTPDRLLSTEDFIYEPLSIREKMVQYNNCPDSDKDIESGLAECNTLNWKPGKWFSRPNEKSKSYEMRKQYNKISVTHISGHTLGLLFILDLLNITKKEKYACIFAIMLWMVPFHHSMNEILLACRVHRTPDKERLFDYDYKQPTVKEAKRLYKLAFGEIHSHSTRHTNRSSNYSHKSRKNHSNIQSPKTM